MGRIWFGALAGAVGLVEVAACVDSVPAPPAPGLAVASCADAGACGSGLTCTTSADNTSLACLSPFDASVDLVAEGQSCRLRTSLTPTRGALKDGFAPAPEMAIAAAVDPDKRSTVVRWFAPAGASSVTCGLFACSPAFTQPFDRGDGRFVRALGNLDRCALNLITSSAAEGQVDIGALSENSRCAPAFLRSADAGADTVCSQGYVVEELTVGCWATDGTKVVGASTLKDVDPVATFLGDRLAGDCSLPAHDGRACRRRGEGRLGTCVRGACAQRCQSPADCQSLAPTVPPDLDGGGEAGAPPACAFTCDALPNRRDIGACRSLAEATP